MSLIKRKILRFSAEALAVAVLSAVVISILQLGFILWVGGQIGWRFGWI